MSSDTTDKDKEKEEPLQNPINEQHLPIHPQLDASHPVPPHNGNGSPLPSTAPEAAPHLNFMETQPPTLHLLPASTSFDATAADFQPTADLNAKPNELPDTKTLSQFSASSQPPANPLPQPQPQPQPSSQPPADINAEAVQLSDTKIQPQLSASSQPSAIPQPQPSSQPPESISEQPATPKPHAASSDIKPDNVYDTELKNEVNKIESPLATPLAIDNSNSRPSFLFNENYEGSESGTEEEQSAFMKELETFFSERSMEFKPPKFYGEGLNCLKLWRAVTRLGGYDKVTSCKLWRQVGESFKPPKTCTTVSWTFRGFYEKALLDYERHKACGGEISLSVASPTEPMNIDNQASGSGRARRDAAARAMQGWHSQRVLGNGEVSDPIIKDKSSLSLQKREKQLKSLGLLKRKKAPYMEHAVKAARSKPSKPQLDVAVVDIGQPADWVKINVQKTKDCFEVYALVPGLLREEVRVQSDPAGRLVISGEPEHPNNPWGVTPFKKVVSLPARIDPHQTSAVVTLHGQLFVRVPFEQSD